MCVSQSHGMTDSFHLSLKELSNDDSRSRMVPGNFQSSASALSDSESDAASASNDDKAIALQEIQNECEELREMKNNSEAQAAAAMVARRQVHCWLLPVKRLSR